MRNGFLVVSTLSVSQSSVRSMRDVCWEVYFMELQFGFAGSKSIIVLTTAGNGAGTCGLALVMLKDVGGVSAEASDLFASMSIGIFEGAL